MTTCEGPRMLKQMKVSIRRSAVCTRCFEEPGPGLQLAFKQDRRMLAPASYRKPVSNLALIHWLRQEGLVIASYSTNHGENHRRDSLRVGSRTQLPRNSQKPNPGGTTTAEGAVKPGWHKESCQSTRYNDVWLWEVATNDPAKSRDGGCFDGAIDAHVLCYFVR